MFTVDKESHFMQAKNYLLLIVLFLGGFSVWSQNTRNVTTPTPPAPVYGAEKETKFTIFKKKASGSDAETVEFRKRMKKVAKKNRKNERLALKPQYSDALYFGHKKPPKKRKNGKKKFCKECGMTH